MKKYLSIILFIVALVGCGVENPKVQVTVTPPKQSIVEASMNDFKINFDRDNPRDMFELIGYQYMKNSPSNSIDASNILIFKLKDKENGNLVYVTNSGNGIGISVIKP